MGNTVTFMSRDGLGINGTIERARTNACLGAALLVHGIHSEQHESGFYSNLAEGLASEGVTSLRFDWRTQGSNRMPAQELSLFGIVNDIHAAWRHLREDVGPASTKLALVASSFGGGPGIVWAKENAHESGLKVAVLLAPVLDYSFDIFRSKNIDSDGFVDPDIATELDRAGFFTVSGGALKVGRALVNELPHFRPGQALTDASFPVSVIHGEQDTDVPLATSRHYAESNRLAQLEVVPHVDHGFVRPGTEFTDPQNHETHAQVINRIRTLVLAAVKESDD